MQRREMPGVQSVAVQLTTHAVAFAWAGMIFTHHVKSADFVHWVRCMRSLAVCHLRVPFVLSAALPAFGGTAPQVKLA